MMYRVWILSDRTQNGQRQEMYAAAQYPASWTDISEQANGDVAGVAVFTAYGEISDAQFATISNDNQFFILRYEQVNAQEMVIASNASETLAANDLAKIRNWFRRLAKYSGFDPADIEISVGMSRRAAGGKAVEKLKKAAVVAKAKN